MNIVAFIQQVLDSSTGNSGSNTRQFCRQEDCRDHECGFFARILFFGTIKFVAVEYCVFVLRSGGGIYFT